MSWTPTLRAIGAVAKAISLESAVPCNLKAATATAINAVAAVDPIVVGVAIRDVSRFAPRRGEMEEISRGGPPY